VCSDRGGGGDLHHLRGGLPLLYRKSLRGPLPKDVLRVPILYTICLLSSSLTIHAAAKALRRGSVRSFGISWFATIALGATFLYGTATEWRRLIYHDGLTISTNLFGTTTTHWSDCMAFTCGGPHVPVRRHGIHIGRAVTQEHVERIDVLSLYWHFVDAVWIVVFTVVYVIGR